MKNHFSSSSGLEPLEQRIAPANVVAITLGQPKLVTAGQILSTSSSGGSYLLYVESGQALVYSTDLNGNGQFDFNEITGISAGDGLKMDCFVNINGDIVTNLNPDGTLTDSDHNAANGRDGAVLLNSHIVQIDLRSVSTTDSFIDSVNNPVSARIALSSYSIFGNIYAGGGIGSTTTPGLIIDDSGIADQQAKFDGFQTGDLFHAFTPSIGSIIVGTAASGQSFRLGFPDSANPVSGTGFITGTLAKFTPLSGTNGADISGVMAVHPSTQFNINQLIAGDGGFGGRGGNITNVTLNAADAGGFSLIAGNGGDGDTGGAGGSIVNFSVLNTITSQVIVKTGNGGNGINGAGGNGGTATFGTVNLVAGMQIILGSGGDGFTSGGNGSSLTQAVITMPEPPLAKATNIVSTYRLSGDIGQVRQIDFNNNGFGDFVFTSANPDQIGVVLDGSQTVYLNAPEGASGIAVGDFNNDGNLDIAVTSGSSGSFDGVRVFLGDGNGGFGRTLYSPIPSLFSTAFSQLLGYHQYYRGAIPIPSISVGDFNGDGTLDLGLGLSLTINDVGFDPASASMILLGNGAGYFYADTTQPFYFEYANIHGSTPIVHATALTTGGTDVLIAGSVGSALIGQMDYSGNDLTFMIKSGLSGTPASTDPTLVDFVIADTNINSKADLAVLDTTPEIVSIVDLSSGTTPGNASNISVSDVHKLIAVDTTGSGTADTIMGYSIPSDSTIAPSISSYIGASSTVTFHQLAPNDPTYSIIDTYIPALSSPTVFKYAYAEPHAGATTSSYNGNPAFVLADDIIIRDSVGPDTSIPLRDNFLFIQTQHGGNSFIGAAGAGGSVGSGLVTVNNVKQGSVAITMPASRFYEGYVSFLIGDGGDGFTKGGNGGSINGTSVTYAGSAYYSSVFLQAGNGGNAISGAGGSGGNLSSNHIVSGTSFIAGNGGNGTIGGNGGSVIGNGVANFPDNLDPYIYVQAGNGGDGVTKGGNGGNISSFINDFIVVAQSEGGELKYFAGNGGNAAGGAGGNGGSIISSSPYQLDNHLSANSTQGLNGDILVQAGKGGNGLSGGTGGNISNFVNSPTGSSIPSASSLLAGDGGAGVSGVGGQGGSISGTNITTQGSSSSGYMYNRLIAGNGGLSSGSTGGAGGNLTNNASTAATTAVAMAAGRGGDGMQGGAGGSVSTTTADAGTSSSVGKILVIAGDGGDAYAFLPSGTSLTQNTFAFGGKNGLGGNGGAISGLTQPVTTSVNVDLIAGNGGNTPNSGSIIPGSISYVGKGGSISSINVQGNIGDSDVGAPIDTAPIKAYNNILSGTAGVDLTMADFVKTTLLNNPTVALDDSVGNVGIVAGAAGRIINNDPAASGINGSVTNVKATNIMSMVAGSVDRIAAIQSISGITVSAGGILGDDKGTLGQLDYNDSSFNDVQDIQVGYQLIDGAIVGKVVSGISGQRVFTRS